MGRDLLAGAFATLSAMRHRNPACLVALLAALLLAVPASAQVQCGDSPSSGEYSLPGDCARENSSTKKKSSSDNDSSSGSTTTGSGSSGGGTFGDGITTDSGSSDSDSSTTTTKKKSAKSEDKDKTTTDSTDTAAAVPPGGGEPPAVQPQPAASTDSGGSALAPTLGIIAVVLLIAAFVALWVFRGIAPKDMFNNFRTRFFGSDSPA